MIQPKTPKKIKGARKKLSAQRKAKSAREKAISDAEIIEYMGTYYIPQHIFYSHPEISELMKDIPANNIQIVKTCNIGKTDCGF